MKSILGTLFFVFLSISSYGQLCYVCNGTGSVWERKLETKYNDVILQRDGTYTYNTKDYVSRRYQHACVSCNGTGTRQVRPRPKKSYYKGPTVRSGPKPPTTIRGILERDFYRTYSKIELNGAAYHIVQHKSDHEKFSLIKITGTTAYQTLASNADEIKVEKGEEEAFFAFRVYKEGQGTQYLNANGTVLHADNSLSYLASPPAYYWVHRGRQIDSYVYTDNVSAKTGKAIEYFGLYDANRGTYVLPDEYYPTECDCMNMWEEEGLLDVAKVVLVDEKYMGYDIRVGIVNRDNEMVIPASYKRVDKCLEEGVISMVDEFGLIRRFDKTGAQLESPIEDVKTCADGNKLVRSKYQSDIYNRATETRELKDKWIYELFSPDMQPLMPSIMESCGCYDEDGWAEVVPVNSEDNFLLHRDGSLVLKPSDSQPINYVSEYTNRMYYVFRPGIQKGLETGIMYQARVAHEQNGKWALSWTSGINKPREAIHHRVQLFAKESEVAPLLDQGDGSCETFIPMPRWMKNRKEELYSQKAKNGDCGCTFDYYGTKLFDRCSPTGIVEKNGKLGYLDLVPAKYQSILPYGRNALMVQDFKGKWGLLELSDKGYVEQVKCSYDAVYKLRSYSYLGVRGNYYDKIVFGDKKAKEIIPLNKLSEVDQLIVELNQRFPDFRGIDPAYFFKGLPPERIDELADFKITYGLPKAVLKNGRVILFINDDAVLLDEGLVEAAFPYEDYDQLTSVAVQHKNGKWGLLKYNHQDRGDDIIYQQVVQAATGYDSVQVYYYDDVYDALPVFSNENGYYVLRNYRPFDTYLPRNITMPYLIQEK
jgi:hypothetical protein